jgi:hypothetical protein
VFPDPDYRPTILLKTAIDFPIALDVTGQLPLPKLPVGLWHGRVLGAPMPKAAIYIDGDVSRAEDDVGAAAQAGNRTSVNPESKTSPM